jgi:hypothetical protein
MNFSVHKKHFGYGLTGLSRRVNGIITSLILSIPDECVELHAHDSIMEQRITNLDHLNHLLFWSVYKSTDIRMIIRRLVILVQNKAIIPR